MICLDTTFIIDLLNEEEAAVRAAVSIESKQLFTTQINVFEVLYGEFLINDMERIETFNRFLGRLTVLNLDHDGTLQSARLATEMARKGKMMNKFDCLIAGIALAHGVTTIVTRNVKDFSKIAGLKVETY